MSPETKENLGAVQNLGITLGSGVVAGFAAAILSHVSGLQILGMFGIFTLQLFHSFVSSHN
jgi:hypothetical protein